jgi:hypothetical protein
MVARKLGEGFSLNIHFTSYFYFKTLKKNMNHLPIVKHHKITKKNQPDKKNLNRVRFTFSNMFREKITIVKLLSLNRTHWYEELRVSSSKSGNSSTFSLFHHF